MLPHFIAVKALGNSPDPFPQRWGIIRGERDLVPVPDHALAMPGNAGKPYQGRTTAGGNLDELRACYGPRLGDRQREAVASIRDAIEATRAATKGARHPTYMRSAATIVGLCRYWCIGLDEPRELLEEAYLSTLDPDEARKREVGSVYGVWNWLESGEARQQPKELHPAVLASIAAGWSGDRL